MIRPRNNTPTARGYVGPDVDEVAVAVASAFKSFSDAIQPGWPTAVSHKSVVETYDKGRTLVRVWLVVPEEVDCTEEAGRALLAMADGMKAAMADAGVGRGMGIDARVVVGFLDDESETVGES